jgi:SAM-dependent methyltransferase
MTKYCRYQDYVIKNGQLVGEFEEMYRDFQDPWEQTTREEFAAEKSIALNAIEALNSKTVLELGCGLGRFTKRIKALGTPLVVGMDVSATAIEKARSEIPECTFEVGDILDYEIYERYKPDVIVMAEISWYVLGKLEKFKTFLREKMPETFLIHLLNTYPDGEQKYGQEFFSDLPGILRYFDMNYVEYGSVHKPFHGNCDRTYFIGRYAKVGQTKL